MSVGSLASRIEWQLSQTTVTACWNERSVMARAALRAIQRFDLRLRRRGGAAAAAGLRRKWWLAGAHHQPSNWRRFLSFRSSNSTNSPR